MTNLIGQRVVVSNKSRMDKELEGCVGVASEITSNGYLRMQTDEGRNLLVHPESVEVL